MTTRFTSIFSRAAIVLLLVIIAPPTEAWAQTPTITYNKSDGYRLIASPLADQIMDEQLADILRKNNYDLFSYVNDNGVQEWCNYEESPFGLEPCKGYLYANSEDVDLVFDGVLYNGNGYIDVKEGWNLLGNSYNCNAYLVNEEDKALPYYKLNDEGTGIVIVDDISAINSMEGFFYYAKEDGIVILDTGEPEEMADDYVEPSELLELPGQGQTGNQEYTITWLDGDGNTLKTEQVASGQTPAYTGVTPTKTATAQYTYTFNNTWSPAITSVTGPATYTAQFNSTVNKYTVNFVDEDGTGLSSAEYDYGTAAANIVKPADPTKAATAQYTYTFNGWSPAIAEVTGNATYTATYNSTVNQYTVTFEDEDGTELSSAEYDYGTAAADIVRPADPTKEATAQYTYTFSGWSPAIALVTGNATYTATYSSVENPIVAYIDADGKLHNDLNHSTETTEDDGVQAIPLNGTEQVLGVDGTETWYVCNTAATANGGNGLSYTSGLTLYGNVHLILADGCKMTVMNSSGDAIYGYSDVSTYATSFYGQSAGTGKLIANVNGSYNGINSHGGDINISHCKVESSTIYANKNLHIAGGEVKAITTSGSGIETNSGTITINGCDLTATGSQDGIHSNNDLTITGGKVTATGTSGNGIATNSSLTKGSITINDCDLTSSGYYGINAIRNITITGGKVNATGTNGHGIYANGNYPNGGNVTISNCEIIATASSTQSSLRGIYATGSITITGSNVTASSTSQDGCGIEAINGSVTISDESTINASGTKGINGKGISITGGTVTASGSGSSGISSMLINAPVTISGCNLIASGYCGIYAASDITITGGTVEASGTYKGIQASNISLDWTAATDYIWANSYYGIVSTATGKRFMAYTPSETPDTEGFDPSVTGTAITALVSGSSNDSDPTFTLDAIAGKTLKPFEGYVVSTPAGFTAKSSPDFTITKGTGAEAVTVPYYIYEASTEANPVTVTLSYSGDLVTLGGLPEGTTLSAVEGQAMQRSFTMPATDVALTATDVTSLTATTVTYNGEARTPVIKQGDDVFADTNYTIAYKLGNEDVTEADVKDANTYTCTLTGLGQYVGTASVDFTINKADFYQSDQILDITKYVPSDKAGSFTIELPELPDGATYSCYIGEEDDVTTVISTAPTITSGELTFTTNSGKAAGTRATITVEAKDAPNYNDYTFKVDVTVSAYTVAYAWPEQTSIWLDADNELVWAESGVTLDRSKLTVKKGSATVTDYTAKVGDTTLTAGGNTLTLEPGAYRIAITGDNGQLDDWVDFKVIKLVEDGQDLTLNVRNWTYPEVALKTEEELVPEWAAIVGSVKYGDTTIELSKNDISKVGGIDNESLKLWFTNADKPGFSESVFLTRELTIDDFDYDGGTRGYITPFGSVVDVGGYNVYLPNHVTVKQLLDDDGNAVPAGDNGGKIYYMCNSRPDLHIEKSETEVGEQTVTELTLYNGDTPVTEGYYFRNGDDFYYGNGENAYKSYGGDDGFISFWPVKSYAQGSVYPMGDKPVTQAHAFDGNLDPIFDENGNPKYDSNTLACGNYTKTWESHYESRWNVITGTLYVGKNYVYYASSEGFLYTGNVVPSVRDHKLWIGNYYVPLGTGNDHVAVALMPNDEIDGSQASDVWILPHAYARYKADDYHYQIADQEFIIYANNSNIVISDKHDEYRAGEDAEINVKLYQLKRGMNVFVNGSFYQRFEGYGDHTLKIEDLREGKYEIYAFGDGDDYVTSKSTSTTFWVVKRDPVLTLTGTTPAGSAFTDGAEFQYDPEKPVIITAANDADVSGTSWKWTISDTDVVTQNKIVNNSGANDINRESIYLNTVELGEVTVTARFSGNELYNPARKSITFTVAPLMTTLFVANTTNQWMTWCNAYAWTLPEGCNAYTINSVSGTTVTLNEIKATEANAPVIIPAYTPVLIYRETAGTNAVKATFSAEGTVPASGYDSATGLASTTDTGWTFYGNAGSTKFTDDGETQYVHTIEEYDGTQSYVLRGGVFLKIDKDEGIAAHRCWLNVTPPTGEASARLEIAFDTTGIDSMDNGQWIMDNYSGPWYDMQGRKLNGKPTKKGLYIHNGVKTVIK